MEQNYFQKMSGAIAAAESLRYIDLSLDEVGTLCDVPTSLLEAAILSVSPDILLMRERVRVMLDVSSDAKAAAQSEEEFPVRPQSAAEQSPIQDFELKIKNGVRQSSFDKYASSIYTYATSTLSLQKICRKNRIPCNPCRAFMMHYYPEAAQRHTDVLEGRFAVRQEETEQEQQDY